MKTAYIFFISLLPVCEANAQLCSGSLGDPVVQIDFGSGNNPGGSLAAASTSYGYVTNDCPGDGYYTVRNSTSNCFSSSWYNLAEDHTPNDVNGYFMLVNASYQPGDFYIETVPGLCANTTYEFAAWVINVLKTSACNSNGIDPNLTFKIETTGGTVLATYNTGDIGESFTPVWKQYGVFFKTPSNTTTVIVRITNNAPGGCGNDLALDDITFRPCGSKVTAALAISGDTSVNVCQGDATSFQLNAAYSGGYNNPVFQWQSSLNGNAWTDIAGATQTTYLRTSTTPGQYRYRLTIAESDNIGLKNCSIASNFVTIYVNPLPVVQMNHQTQACMGSTVTLSASGAVNYQWTGPNGLNSSSSQLVLTNVGSAQAGLYRLTASSNTGCSITDSTTLSINPLPVAGINGAKEICEGTNTQLQASGGIKYAWSPVMGLSSAIIPDPLASPKDTTTYKVVVSNQYGCADSANITINVWKKPLANAGPDKKTMEGFPVTLEGSATGTDISYIWTPPSFLDRADKLKPVATPSGDFTYTLVVTSNKGCGISSDDAFVKVYKKIIIPNAFSPNGDGVNDSWVIEGLFSYPNAELQVFNRYGQMVYSSKNYNNTWKGTYNGKPLPSGTYYYVIDLKIDQPVLGGWVVIIK